MQSRKPAPLNVVPDDTTGTIWALPEGAIVRFGKGVNRSCPELGSVTLSPDGTYFAVGTGMGLWWYDVSSMAPIALWETERGLISAVDISPDGNSIAVSNWDGIVKVLDVQSGECITRMKRYEKSYTRAEFIVFSPDSKWVATATREGVIEVLDIQCSECIAQPEPDSRGENRNVTSQLAFSPNGEIIAATCTTPRSSGLGWVSVATKAPQTYLWHAETGKRIAKVAGGGFTFSPDNRLLACTSPDDTDNDAVGIHRFVSVWDIETKEHIACFKEHENQVNSIVFSPCGNLLASSDRGGTVRVWDLTMNAQKMKYTHYGIVSKRWLWKILRWLQKWIGSENLDMGLSRVEPFYSQEETLLAAVLRPSININTNLRAHTIEVWDIERRQKLQTIERKPRSIGAAWFSKCPELGIAYAFSNKSQVTDETHTFLTLRESTCYPDLVAFSPDGQVLASNDGDGKGVVLWDVERKQERETLMKNTRISSFTFLPSGSLLAAGIDRNTLKVWDFEKQDKPVAEFSAPGLASPVVFAPIGDRIATVRCESNKERIERTLYVWNLQSREKLEVDTGHKGYIHSIAFSLDGRRLATACWDEDGIAQLWDTETGREIAKVEDHREIRGITFSPCGAFIAGGWADEIRLWRAENFDPLHTIPQPEGSQRPYALTFSPCSKYLASGTWWQREKGMEKMAIRLWDVATGENIHTFWGHTTDVQSLAFSPDGMFLASGGFDGTILLWDVEPFIGS